jgi:PAS domain-containing protein
LSSEGPSVKYEEMLRQTEELEAMREQLEAERRRYRDLFEFLPDAYLVTDTQGKILEANRAAVALLNPESANLGSKFLISAALGSKLD